MLDEAGIFVFSSVSVDQRLFIGPEEQRLPPHSELNEQNLGREKNPGRLSPLLNRFRLWTWEL